MNLKRTATALVGSAALLATASPAWGGGELPMELPGSAGTAGTSTWLVGTRTPVSAREARALGGRAILGGRVLVVARGDARKAAARLDDGGNLLYAEPDANFRRSSAWESQRTGWARGSVVASSLAAPTPGSATVAVVDDFVDASHPDLAGNVTFLNSGTRAGPHGTAVASAAAGIDGNGGVFGVFPGAKILSVQPPDMTCAGVAEAVRLATAAKPDVINLSLGSPSDCLTLRIPIQVAFGAGSIVVAASGNEFDEGNPVIYPAAWPHVVSVAAVTRSLKSAYFSTSNAAVDISAPGVSVPVAVPISMDTDDESQDGYAAEDGTSFSSPMVAGAAAWVGVARQDMSPGQVADLLRQSARDLLAKGWDKDTGWGLLNVGGALTAEAPLNDPSEPNDLISEVSGRLFSTPDEFIWRGGAETSFEASVDRTEDPADIYRIEIPALGAATVSVTPTLGNADLELYSGSATYVGQRARRIGYSRRTGKRTDRVSVRNRGQSAAAAYVVVKPSTRGYLNAEYRLRVAP